VANADDAVAKNLNESNICQSVSISVLDVEYFVGPVNKKMKVTLNLVVNMISFHVLNIT
jgi:hypothetical protein